MILALETSGNICSVSIVKNGVPIYYSEFIVQKSHAEVLNILVDQALVACNISAAEIVAVAVSIGPGSYTGLRIGLSSAKGLCLAWDIPLITVDTLEAMSLQVVEFGLDSTLYIPMLDARRMEVFTASYNKKLELVGLPKSFIFDEGISENWYLENEGGIFFGDGAAKGKDFINKIKNATLIENIFPKANHVGILGYKKFHSGEFADLAYQEPFYLKPFYTTAQKIN